MLENPDPADWLNWRRTLDGWGYSPLNQINTENVHQLQLVWSWQLPPGLSQPTPLVHDGVMFIPSPQFGLFVDLSTRIRGSWSSCNPMKIGVFLSFARSISRFCGGRLRGPRSWMGGLLGGVHA